MKLYFKNSHGEMRVIAEFDSGKTGKGIFGGRRKRNQKFCDERNFKIHYTRVWHTDYKGQQMTKFDVGSHSEFFYLDQVINLKGVYAVMLVIPDHSGCMIVANGKCCAYSGSADAIVKQCFVDEMPIDGGTTLIAPKIKEVEILMNSIAGAVFSDAFKENGIKVVEITHGTPKQIFSVKRME